MDNQFAMMLIQSVLADPEGRAGIVETATGFLESLGVTYVELHAAGTETPEGGTPREMVTLLVDAIAERFETIEIEVPIEEGGENG